MSFPLPLLADWWMTLTPPAAASRPSDILGDVRWIPCTIPGTAAAALRDDVQGSTGELVPLHDHDVWYRASVEVTRKDKLRFQGLAGIADIWLDDDLKMSSSNMFTSSDVDVDVDAVQVHICFKSLNAALRQVSGRSRWRTKLVSSNALRMYRQTLLGHMPGWCPAVHAVGPFRPITHLRDHGTLETCSLTTTVDYRGAVLAVRLGFLKPPPDRVVLAIWIDGQSAPLYRRDGYVFTGELILRDAQLWWPHTHGLPRLYDVLLSDGTSLLQLGRVGFRTITAPSGDDGNDFRIEVNGTAVFCRGACWTSADLVGLRSDRQTYLDWLVLARDAGMNMIRISGIMLYEGDGFHGLCDELGILVWQDLMFANFDYPVDKVSFRDTVLVEVGQLVQRLGASPSLAVICGGSEMAQQAVMLGLDARRRLMPFFETVLPEFIHQLRPDLIYVPNSPWGGSLPISVNAGIAHYYGVGAYERPLEDARRAGIRFATECLAFANLSSSTSTDRHALTDGPHDIGATWNFADTRDHYLQRLYLVDPGRLRAEDPGRYLELSRAVAADVMEAVFAEWRRPGSTCSGGLVWQLQDLAPGSGWGVIDSEQRPKAAWHGLQRILAPIQLILADEGLNGLDIHVLNETDDQLEAVIELKCLNRSSTPVIAARHDVLVPGRGSISVSSYVVHDGFFDITRSYRFGPAEHAVTVATLFCSETQAQLSQAFHFPLGRSLAFEDPGLTAEIVEGPDGWQVRIATVRFAQAVHVEAEGYRAHVNWFHMRPSEVRLVQLHPLTQAEDPPMGSVKALNSHASIYFKGVP